MLTFLIAIPLFLLAVIGLALGVLLKRRALGGSCGNCALCLLRRSGS